MSVSVFLRRAAAGDVGRLVTLEREASLHPWSETQIATELARPAPDAVLVLDGRAGVRAWCAFRLAVGELSVLNLAVHPAERRRGLGRFLLEAALRTGAAAGASRALLEVRASNVAARTLYSLFGFEPLGVRRDYYSEPLEDGLVLARDLAGRQRASDGSNRP